MIVTTRSICQKEPQYNAWWALNGIITTAYLLICQLSGSLVHVNVGFFAHQVGIATTHTLHQHIQYSQYSFHFYTNTRL